MGASLSVVKSYEVKEIYEFCFLYGLSIAELEYLYRRFEEVIGLQAPLPNVLSRVLIVLFQTSDTSGLTFERFLNVFHRWKVSNPNEKLELLFQVLDVSEDGELSASDIAFFCKEDELKVGSRIKMLRDSRTGTIRWIGILKGKTDIYYGIELDTATGKNNGSFQGKSYFKCEEGKGIFVNTLTVVSESFLLSIEPVISEFTNENTEKITLETFKSITIKETELIDSLSKSILPKELSNL